MCVELTTITKEIAFFIHSISISNAVNPFVTRKRKIKRKKEKKKIGEREGKKEIHFVTKINANHANDGNINEKPIDENLMWLECIE